MPESRLKKIINELLSELSLDIVEERVVNYIVRELRNGRRLSSILKDPYVKNRLSEERVKKVIENSEVISAVEEKISQAFIKDFQIILFLKEWPTGLFPIK